MACVVGVAERLGYQGGVWMAVLLSFRCECWFVVRWQSERESECVVEKERNEWKKSQMKFLFLFDLVLGKVEMACH